MKVAHDQFGHHLESPAPIVQVVSTDPTQERPKISRAITLHRHGTADFIEGQIKNAGEDAGRRAYWRRLGKLVEELRRREKCRWQIGAHPTPAVERAPILLSWPDRYAVGGLSWKRAADSTMNLG